MSTLGMSSPNLSNRSVLAPPPHPVLNKGKSIAVYICARNSVICTMYIVSLCPEQADLSQHH